MQQRIQEIQSLDQDKKSFVSSTSLEGKSISSSLAGSLDDGHSNIINTIAGGELITKIWPLAPGDVHPIDPILNITKSWPPTAIVHGTADIMVPVRLSKQLEIKLRENEVETTFIEMAGESHEFAEKMVKGSRTWRLQRKGFDFLERVLKQSY
jgi:hypothetical protein